MKIMQRLIDFKNKNPVVVLFLGIAISILYKFWKLNLSVITNSDYYYEQTYFSFFRIMASIFTLLFFFFFEREFYSLFKIKSFKQDSFLVIVIFLCLFCFRYFYLDGFVFKWQHFYFELIVNGVVGLFEELIFRGLIFIGLTKILDLKSSILISACFFSLWHYDVVPNFSTYLVIFTFGLMSCHLIINKISFFTLILIHAINDIIVFGFFWNKAKSLNVINFIDGLSFLFIIFLVSYYQPKKVPVKN